MKFEHTKEITVTLILSKKEAEWLHAVVQNPIDGDGSTESLVDIEMRKNFFAATNI